MNNELKEKVLKGLELCNNNEYDKAESFLKEAADVGDVYGMYGMGLIHFHRHNEKDGIKMLEKVISMKSGEISVLSKIACAEYYFSGNGMEGIFKSVYYYDSVLDDIDYPDLMKKAADSIKVIRTKLNNRYKHYNLNLDEAVLKSIRLMKSGHRSDAEELLKVAYILGNELSYFGLGLLFYDTDNDMSIDFFERYINRTELKQFVGEAYALIVKKYEEIGDEYYDSDPSEAMSWYTKVLKIGSQLHSDSSASNTIDDINQICTRVTRKFAVLSTEPEIPEYEPSNEELEIFEHLEQSVLPNMKFFNADGTEEISSYNKKTDHNEVNAVQETPIKNCIYKYANSFNHRKSICFPNSDEYIKGGKYTYTLYHKMCKSINNFAQYVNISDILFYCDYSFFGNGKEGIIFTENIIYYKKKNEQFNIGYIQISNTRVEPGSISKVYMTVNGNDYEIFSTDNINEANLIKKMLTECIETTKITLKKAEEAKKAIKNIKDCHIIYVIMHRLSNSKWPLLSNYIYTYSNKNKAETECSKINRKHVFVKEMKYEDFIQKIQEWKYIGYKAIVCDCNYDDDVNEYINKNPDMVIKKNIEFYNGVALQHFAILSSQYKVDDLIEQYNEYFNYLIQMYKETFFCVPIFSANYEKIPVSWRVNNANNKTLFPFIGTENKELDYSSDKLFEDIKNLQDKNITFVPASTRYDIILDIISKSDIDETGIGICNEADLFCKVGGYPNPDTNFIKIYLEGEIILYRTANDLKLEFPSIHNLD